MIVVQTGHSRRPRKGAAVTLGVTPDRRFQRLHHPVDPVFVDRSGRRRRALRRFALAASILLACLGLVLGAAMLNSRAPAPPLPATPNANPNP
jgi:hypothetical protein